MKIRVRRGIFVPLYDSDLSNLWILGKLKSLSGSAFDLLCKEAIEVGLRIGREFDPEDIGEVLL